MNSCLRICVVISTVLVLGTPHPQNYGRPNYHQRWDPEHQIYPLRQRRNYQASGPEVANTLNFQQYPIAREPVVVNANEEPQTVHHANHDHTIRKVSVPFKDLEQYKNARIVHLPPSGKKGMRVLRVNVDTGEVHEETNITDALKLIIDKALATNRPDSETIHRGPVSRAVSLENDQKHFTSDEADRYLDRHVWPRRRYRNPDANYARPNAGYPFRRRRPFQINHNAPIQVVRRPPQVLVIHDNEGTLDKTEHRSEEHPDVITPVITKAIETDNVEKTTVRDEKLEVVSDFTDKRTIVANEQSTGKINSETILPNNVESTPISTLIKDFDNEPVVSKPPALSDENFSVTSAVTLAEPLLASREGDDSVETKYIVSPISSESEELSTTVNDDHSSIETRSLLTTLDDSDSTEDITDDNDDFVTVTNQKPTDTESPMIESIIATDLTTKFTKPTTTINHNDKSAKFDYYDTKIHELESTPLSTNQDTPVFTQLHVSKSHGHDPKTSLHAHRPSHDKNPVEELKKSPLPYVIISPLKSENATKEESLFNTLIDFLIGKKKINETSEYEELENDEDKTKILLERDNQFRRMYQIPSKSVRKTNKEANNSEAEIGENNDVTGAENEALTPISFLSRLVQSAFNGGDSLKNLFSKQNVKDFILKLSKMSSN